MTSPEELIAFLQIYSEGISLEEIADKMMLSIGSVPSAVSRARKVCPKGKTIKCFKEIYKDLYRTEYRSYYKLVEVPCQKKK